MTYEKAPRKRTDEEPQPNPHDPVTFLGDEGEDRRPASVAAMHIQQAGAAAALEPVKVKVRAPYRVVHEATPHTAGNVVEVPRQLADAWIAKNWAEALPATITKEK